MAEERTGVELISYLQKRFASLWKKLSSDSDPDERDFFLEEYLRDLEERAYLETTIANQYRGRYLVELVQNAVDAMQRQAESTPTTTGYRCHIQLTSQALYVANDGEPFGPEDVRGLTAMGKSTKGEGRYIGYKGLGFRSVLEVTDAPEIYSEPYNFGFSRAETLSLLKQGTGGGVAIGDVPALSVPFTRSPEELPLEERKLLAILKDRGYVTIIRLPLKPDIYSDIAFTCREFLNSHSLLFLPHITELTLEIAGNSPATLHKTRSFMATPPAYAETVQMERISLTLKALEEIDGINEVREKSEEWLLVSPTQPLTVSREYVESLNDRTWLRVKTATLALALPMRILMGGDVFFKRRLEPLPFFTHFPTKEMSGMGIALHADFYLSASRKEIDGDLTYNRWLVRSAVEFICNRALPALHARFPDDAALLDLLPDIAYHSGPFGFSFRQVLDEQLAATAFIPVGGNRYRKSSEVVWTPMSGAGVLLFRKIFPQPPGGLYYPVLQLEETYIAEEEGFDYKRIRRFLRDMGMRTVTPQELPELLPQAHKGWIDGTVSTADICNTLALWYEELAKNTMTPEERQRSLLQVARGLPVLPIGRSWEIPNPEKVVYDWPATEQGRNAIKARQEFFGPVVVISEHAYSNEGTAEEQTLERKKRLWFQRLGTKTTDPDDYNTVKYE